MGCEEIKVDVSRDGKSLIHRVKCDNIKDMLLFIADRVEGCYISLEQEGDWFWVGVGNGHWYDIKVECKKKEVK